MVVGFEMRILPSNSSAYEGRPWALERALRRGMFVLRRGMFVLWLGLFVLRLVGIAFFCMDVVFPIMALEVVPSTFSSVMIDWCAAAASSRVYFRWLAMPSMSTYLLSSKDSHRR